MALRLFTEKKKKKKKNEQKKEKKEALTSQEFSFERHCSLPQSLLIRWHTFFAFYVTC